MDLDVLTTQLPALEAELVEWRRREQEAGSRADNLERIIEGIKGLAPEAVIETPPASENGTSLRGIAAIRAVVSEHPERIWTARDVHNVLEQREWLSPHAQHPLRGTEAAINRLITRGELERLRPGRYKATEELREPIEED